MLITSLSVEGIGRFASAAHVDGFGSGVNVLAAGNEVGKSTLFKAIRTCLFCRHDSRTQEIRDLGSDDSQLPATVELAFEHDGKRYVVKKSFLRSPSAILSEDGREIARFAERVQHFLPVEHHGPRELLGEGRQPRARQAVSEQLPAKGDTRRPALRPGGERYCRPPCQ
jgi:DNA repair exonuclease SbcCD ATPase subunit